jgi:hypothetical protein
LRSRRWLTNEDSIMKKATRPIEKNRRTRSKPAKIRHLQKQQKLWMVSKMEWRKPGTKPGLAPSSFLQHVLVACGVSLEVAVPGVVWPSETRSPL